MRLEHIEVTWPEAPHEISGLFFSSSPNTKFPVQTLRKDYRPVGLCSPGLTSSRDKEGLASPLRTHYLCPGLVGWRRSWDWTTETVGWDFVLGGKETWGATLDHVCLCSGCQEGHDPSTAIIPCCSYSNNDHLLEGVADLWNVCHSTGFQWTGAYGSQTHRYCFIFMLLQQ